MSGLNKKLNCIMPAMLTPLHQDGSFDEKGMEKLVQHLCSKGMSTLVPLGYTGEGRAFTLPVRKEIIRVVKESAPKGTTVIAGCMGDSTRLILEQIEDAADAGVEMVLVPPTDFFWLTDWELENLFCELDQNTALPIVIYNCNENHHFIKPEIMTRLAMKKNIVGLKQSTDIIPLHEMYDSVGKLEDFTLISGHEFILYPALTLGLRSFIMGAPGNITPKMCMDIKKLYLNGEYEKCRELYERFVGFYRELYSYPYPMCMSQMKGCMEIAGLFERWMHSPVKPITNEDLKKLEKTLIKYDIEI